MNDYDVLKREVEELRAENAYLTGIVHKIRDAYKAVWEYAAWGSHPSIDMTEPEYHYYDRY